MKTKNKPPENAIVAKKNSLIEKMSKFKLSELRLIAYCLAHYDSRSEENPFIKAKVSDLTEIFPMDQNSAYSVVRQAMLGINQKPLEFIENNEQHFWNWFSGFKYSIGQGEFSFKINPDIKPYLLGLSDMFSSYRLIEVAQFRSQVSWLLFENLNKWKNIRKWSVGLDELKYLLGVEGKYPRWNSFRERALDPALKEINEQTRLNVSFEKEKRVRTVIGLTFFIDKKQPENTITTEDPRENIHKMLLAFGIRDKDSWGVVQGIERAENLDKFQDKMPKIIKKWNSGKGPKLKWVRGIVKAELRQMDLPFTEMSEKSADKEAQDCWIGKNQTGEECKIRVKGVAGQRKKCQKCLELFPVAEWGIKAGNSR